MQLALLALLAVAPAQTEIASSHPSDRGGEGGGYAWPFAPKCSARPWSRGSSTARHRDIAWRSSPTWAPRPKSAGASARSAAAVACGSSCWSATPSTTWTGSRKCGPVGADALRPGPRERALGLHSDPLDRRLVRQAEAASDEQPRLQWAVGRLTAREPAELRGMIDKIVAYERSTDFGPGGGS